MCVCETPRKPTKTCDKKILEFGSLQGGENKYPLLYSFSRLILSNILLSSSLLYDLTSLKINLLFTLMTGTIPMKKKC